MMGGRLLSFWDGIFRGYVKLPGGSKSTWWQLKYSLFSSLFGEKIRILTNIIFFQMGWFNHQLGFNLLRKGAYWSNPLTINIDPNFLGHTRREIWSMNWGLNIHLLHPKKGWRCLFVNVTLCVCVSFFFCFRHTLGIQSYSQLMIGVSTHLLSIVFRFHYHSQKVIGSLGISKKTHTHFGR